MAIFNSFLYVYQRVRVTVCESGQLFQQGATVSREHPKGGRTATTHNTSEASEATQSEMLVA